MANKKNKITGYLCLSNEHTMFTDPLNPKFHLFRHVKSDGTVTGWYKFVKNLDLDDPKNRYIKAALDQKILYYRAKRPQDFKNAKVKKEKKKRHTSREKELLAVLASNDIEEILAFLNGQPIVINKITIKPPKNEKEYRFLFESEGAGENRFGHPRWQVIELILKILDKKYGKRETGMTPIIVKTEEFIKVEKRGRPRKRRI